MFSLLGAGLAAIGGCIGSAISTVGGLATAVGGFLSTSGATIAGVATKIGGVAAKFADKFIGIIGKIPNIGINEILKKVGTVCKVIDAACQILGIDTEDQTKLGAKAQKAEKGIDDFGGDSEAYISYLKNEIKLDKEEFEKMSPGEKLGCKGIGVALDTMALGHKCGIAITPEFLVSIEKSQTVKEIVITGKEFLDIITAFKNAGIVNLNDVVAYLNGTAGTKTTATASVVHNVIESVYPNSNTNDIVDKIKIANRDA